MTNRLPILLTTLALATVSLAQGGFEVSIDARAQVLALADARRFDPSLVASLSANGDNEVRAVMAVTLGELANPGALPFINKLSRDKVAGVRAAAAQGAGRLASFLPPHVSEKARLGQVLRRLLDDKDSSVRCAASWGIGMAQVKNSELWLLHRLERDRNSLVKQAILRELWRFPGGAWIKRAKSFIDDRDGGIRFAAAWSLARSNKAEAMPGLHRAIADRDPLVRIVAVVGTRRSHDLKGFFHDLNISALDQDSRVRSAAYDSLAVAFEKELKPQLTAQVFQGVQAAIAATNPERVHERIAAIRLAAFARGFVQELQAIVQAKEAAVAGEALLALARQNAPGVLDEITVWLSSDVTEKRGIAVRALSRIPGHEARVVQAGSDQAALVRLAVATAIDERQDDVTALLRGFLADSDVTVRSLAIDALTKRKALSESEVITLLDREFAPETTDVISSLLTALGSGEKLSPPAREALEKRLLASDCVVARVAWATLAKHEVTKPLPEIKTERDFAFYKQILKWASKPRWMELVTVRGTLQIMFDTARAPLTAWEISQLVEKKYFDGLTFHRVVANFVAQGGDPRGDGSGGPGFAIRDELSLDPYAAGAVGMALSGPDTGGSQIFITLTQQPHLMGRYAVIGRVTKGLDVASRLRIGDKILRAKVGQDNPSEYYPVWYGELDPKRLDGEIYQWRQEREIYKPKAAFLDRLATAKLRYKLVVAMGTWCGDSREQLPRLQSILAALGERSPFDGISYLGVDRSKWIDPALYAYGIVDKVPTIVVTAGGAEIGRIVETPTSTSLEEDLVRILAPIEGWEIAHE